MSPYDPLAVWLAAALVAVPALVGWGIVRRGRPRWWLGLVAVSLLGGLLVPELPLWDLVFAVLALGLGAWCGARRGRGRRLAASVVLFAGVAEVAGRGLLPDAPYVLSDRTWHAWNTDLGDVPDREACQALFPHAYERSPYWADLAFDPDPRPLVLHLGDSMLVFSDTGPPSSRTDRGRFVHRYAASDPERRHLNLGVAGTGMDYQLASARAWADRRVDRVVVYAFTENDLSDLDRRYLCCPGGSLLDYDAPGLPTRCSEPAEVAVHPSPLQLRLLSSIPPLTLQVLTPRSRVAAHLRARLNQLPTWMTPWAARSNAVDDQLIYTPGAEDRRWRWTGELLTELDRELGERLVVVVLPVGPDLDGPAEPHHHSRERAERLLGLCVEAGVRCVDAWDAFRDVPVPAGGWFMRDGYHFADAGHERFAVWLQRALPHE